MHVAAAVLLGLAGLPVGSFLNVVIDRVPDRSSLRGERDGEASAPVSFLGVPAQPWLLRSRGRQELPARWWQVELVTAVVWACIGGRYGFSSTAIPLLVLGAALVAVSVVDLQLLRIPDLITFPTLAACLPLILGVTIYQDAVGAFTGALAGSVAYFVLLLVPHLVYPRGMGFGDVKLAILMGLFLGWLGWTEDHPVAGPLQLVLYGLMLGCLLGVVFGVTTSLITKRRGEFPFGPALALACLAIALLAPDLRIV